MSVAGLFQAQRLMKHSITSAAAWLLSCIESFV